MKMALLFYTISFVLITTPVSASNFSQFFSSSSSSSSATGRFVFSRDSSWTVPTGVTKINVQITGGGGGAPANNSGGGGGGGGSCIKNGTTVLASANGGRGGHTSEVQGQAGFITYTTLTVTAGDTLSIYVGGGGGGGTYYAVPSSNIFQAYGGAGGYGPCGTSGAGGNGTLSGGTGGANLGGGGGAGQYPTSTNVAGVNASTTTGAAGSTGSSAVGGSATAGGGTSMSGGGGGSGGAGGTGGYVYTPTYAFMGTPGVYASNTQNISGTYSDGTVSNFALSSFTLHAGAPGTGHFYSGIRLPTGGGGGEVVISW